MVAVRRHSHNLLLLALLLLIATLLLLLLPADPALAATDPNEPADDDVVSATHVGWWIQAHSLIGHAGDIDFFDIPVPAAGSPHHVTVALDVPQGRDYTAAVALSLPGVPSGLVWPQWTQSRPWAGRLQLEGDVTGPARLYVMVKGGDDGDFSSADAYKLRVYWTNTVSEFPDVPTDHRYHDAIMGMARAAYVNGYTDGRFGPDDLVKRQQFAKMIALAAHLEVTEAMTSPFTDLPADDPGDLYPNEYIAAVAAAGITTGVTPVSFDPGAPIKFAQVVTMVTRFAANYLPPVPAEYVPPFGDFDDTHYPWARKAAYYGLLDGIATPYDWFRAATRGECAKVIWNMDSM